MGDAVENNELIGHEPLDNAGNIILLPTTHKNTSRMHNPISAERVADLLQNAGYKGKIEQTETRNYVESASDGWKFRIYFFDDSSTNASSPQLSLMFSSGWGINQEDVDKIKEAANSFNKQCRYAKAYVDGNEEYKYTEIEMSHFILDGITDDCFNSYTDMFLGLRRTYLNMCKETIGNN